MAFQRWNKLEPAVDRDSVGQGQCWSSVPGVPDLGRGISPRILGRMEQLRCLSASTQRVDDDGVVKRPNQRPDKEVTALDASGNLWGPFQRLRHGRRVVFQRKSVSWK